MNMGWPKRPLKDWLMLKQRSTDALTVLKCRNILADYYYALDTRQHGDIAQAEAFERLEAALGMQWEPGLVKRKRGNGELLGHQK